MKWMDFVGISWKSVFTIVELIGMFISTKLIKTQRNEPQLFTHLAWLISMKYFRWLNFLSLNTPPKAIKCPLRIKHTPGYHGGAINLLLTQLRFHHIEGDDKRNKNKRLITKHAFILKNVFHHRDLILSSASIVYGASEAANISRESPYQYVENFPQERKF